MGDRDEFDVRAIAAALTFVMPGWTLEPEPPDTYPSDRGYRAYLVNQGARLFLHRDGRRLSVSGSFPHGYHPYGENYGITVDPTRDAGTLARDIARRVLTTYLPKIASVLEHQRADVANKLKARAVVQELARVFGCRDPTHSERHRVMNPAETTEGWDLWESFGELHVSSHRPDEVQLKRLTVTVEQARQIAAILRPSTSTRSPHGANANPRRAARRTTRRARA